MSATRWFDGVNSRTDKGRLHRLHDLRKNRHRGHPLQLQSETRLPPQPHTVQHGDGGHDQKLQESVPGSGYRMADGSNIKSLAYLCVLASSKSTAQKMLDMYLYL